MNTEELDENDSSTTTATEDIPKKFSTEHRSSLQLSYTGYERRKSQSVKLTRLDEDQTSAKKAVRFADDFGLDLSQMRVINTDELPSVPRHAFKHLQISTKLTSS